MGSRPTNSLARRDPHHSHYEPGRLRIDSATDEFPLGLFCAAPTVLEAINRVLREQGRPTLWVHADGTIGASDPLLLRYEYVPSPFVC